MTDAVFTRGHFRLPNDGKPAMPKRQVEENPHQEEASRGMAKSGPVCSLVSVTPRVCFLKEVQGDNSVVLSTG